ncbi:hypothetical protein LTS17_004562 [Exophiala oligosperma]
MNGSKADLDPQWLEAEKRYGGRVTLPRESVEESRARFHAMFALIEKNLPPPSPAVKAQDVVIAPGQRVRIFTPVEAAKESTNALPVGFYPHCGGWYAGSVEMEDFLARDVAENAGMIIFSPDYRLAPEHPYPAGLNDVCFAYEWMHKNAAAYGGDPQKKFIMGGSAGGNLTAVLAVKYAADADLSCSGFIAACFPSCDPSALPPEYQGRNDIADFHSAPMLGIDTVLQAREWYNPPRKDDPLYSPLLHPDIKHLKQAYIIATSVDPTYYETLFFYEELKKNGVDVELGHYVGWPHYFWIDPSLPKSKEFMEKWNSKLREMVAAA